MFEIACKLINDLKSLFFIIESHDVRLFIGHVSVYRCGKIFVVN